MRSLRIKILILFLIAVVDSVLTVFLISICGWGEANPLMNWYMELTSLSCMAITKILITLFLLLFMWRRQCTEKYLNFAIPLYVVILSGSIFVQWALIRY